MGEDDVEIIDEEEEKIQMERVEILSLNFKDAFIPIKRRVTKVF